MQVHAGMTDTLPDTLCTLPYWLQIVSFIQLNDFMSARGYTFFLACFYALVAGLVVSVAIRWVPGGAVPSGSSTTGSSAACKTDSRAAICLHPWAHIQSCSQLLAPHCLRSIFVGRSFTNNQFNYVWPIVFLRYFANVFFQASPQPSSGHVVF
jgi:hypothetical protein